MSNASAMSVTGTRVGACLVVTLGRDLGAGALDAVRQVLLDGVQRGGAASVILDCSGVPFMDSHEFGELRKVLRMAELLGARCVLVGLQPGIIVHLMAVDADVRGLQAMLGLDEALQALGGSGGTLHA